MKGHSHSPHPPLPCPAPGSGFNKRRTRWASRSQSRQRCWASDAAGAPLLWFQYVSSENTAVLRQATLSASLPVAEQLTRAPT